jgi:phospholipase/lecithinase/hemolysin
MAERLRTYRHFATWLAAGLLALAAQPAQARLSSLEQLFVFGDSLTDTGNSWDLTGNTFPPAPIYYQGRASNGPVSSEYLWNFFNPGTPGPAPSSSGGTNYAINGASTGRVNFNSFRGMGPPYSSFQDQGAATQLQSFLNDNPTPTFNPNTSLFMVWLFPNDVLAWSVTGQGNDAGTVQGGPPKNVDASGLITTAITNITTMVAALAQKGATHFLVPNAPDLGQTPLFRPNQNLSNLTAAFNSNLDLALQQLQANLGVDITRFQTDDLFADVIQNPSPYGFTNVTEACLDQTNFSVCTNPDQYLFWDAFHPTTAGHRLIAQNFYAATAQTPGPLPVAGVTAAFVWSRRLRHRIKNGHGSQPATTSHSG